MKKYLLALMLACFSFVGASAQDIYKEVVRMKEASEKLMNDSTQSMEVRKVACFKNDALYYLIDKAADSPDFSEFTLGEQANAMIDFVNLFVKRLSQERKKKDKDVILATYKNASTANPLFSDPEKEITYGYVDNEKYLTQFSLDTDWVKALAVVKQKN